MDSNTLDAAPRSSERLANPLILFIVILSNSIDHLIAGFEPCPASVGAALGRLIDHPAANNGGREIIK